MRVRGVRLYVEERGAGVPILFAHGLLWSGRMFEPQVRALQRDHRCIVYDHRGQGRSEVPSGAVITIEEVYADAVALIEALDIAPCHFVGLSMGGFVGLRLAARRPDLLRSLVLIDSAADAEPRRKVPLYRGLGLIARAGALALTRPAVARAMFGRTFMTDPARASARAEAIAELMRNTPSVVAAVEGVLRRASVEDELSRIRVPTLVVHGEEDRAIAMRRARAMCDAIAGARFVSIAAAGHSSTLEQPQAVTTAIAAFVRASDSEPPSRK